MPNLRGTPRSVRVVLPLGTGAVATQTKLVGISEVGGRIKAVRFAGQGAVTATSLVAKVQKLSADGDTATDVSSDRDIKLTAATDQTALSGTLSTVAGVLDIKRGTLFRVVITADACTVGPGDLAVEVEVEPRK